MDSSEPTPKTAPRVVTLTWRAGGPIGFGQYVVDMPDYLRPGESRRLVEAAPIVELLEGCRELLVDRYEGQCDAIVHEIDLTLATLRGNNLDAADA